MVNREASGSKPPTETELLEAAAGALRKRLSPQWTISWFQCPTQSAGGGADALMTVEAPDRNVARFRVTVKTAVTARDIPGLREACGNAMRQVPDHPCLVVTRYLALVDRARLDTLRCSTTSSRPTSWRAHPPWSRLIGVDGASEIRLQRRTSSSSLCSSPLSPDGALSAGDQG